jgi:hypothetical protein
MAFGVANEFEETKASMLAPLPANTEKIERTTAFRQQDVNWDGREVAAPAVKAPEVKSVNNPALAEDAAIAGSSLRNISGVTPSASSSVLSGVKEIGMEIVRDMGELGKELFSIFGSKPEEPAVTPENPQIAAVQQPKYIQPFGL